MIKALTSYTNSLAGILDLFKEFTSLQVDSADLAARLPDLQPRFYSVASSRDYKMNKFPGTLENILFW
jgi:sulfite reductase alpha subunit-like flavoprotein